MAAVNETLSEWLVVALIAFSLAFQLALHAIEARVRRRHPHLQPVLNIVYRELMVLGLVSILFLMYVQLAHPNPTAVHSFEFAHVFIFAFALFFVAAVMSTLAASLRLSAHWKAVEHVPLPRYRALKAEYTALRLRMHARRGRAWRAVGWWGARPHLLRRYRALHETLAFHDLRFQIIFFRRLRDDFRFSAFLRRIKGVCFVHLVEPHYSLWLLFLAAMLADLVRRYASGVAAPIQLRAAAADAVVADHDDIAFQEDVLGSAFIIAAAIALIVIVQILALKIRFVYWHLTKNPRIYYDHVHAMANSSAQLPELDKTASDSRQTRTSLPESSLSPMSLSTPNPHHATAILAHPSSAPAAISGAIANAGISAQSVEGCTWDDMDSQSQPAIHPTGSKSRPGVSFGESTFIESAVTESNTFSAEEQDMEAGVAPAPQPSSVAEEGRDVGKPDMASGHTNGVEADDTADAAMQNELLRHKSLAVTSPTLAKNKEELEQARRTKADDYPWLVTKLIPRLGRKASRAEKLFWFGSHHFFFWCVQFSLFFSTVLTAASSASVLLRLFNDDPITSLNVAALVVSVVCLLFMQLRVAFMLKKYVLVLVSASLLPEEQVKRTIDDLKHKRVSRSWGDSMDGTSAGEDEILEKDDDDEEDDIERDEKRADALQKRKTIGQFFREEAERGNMPGVSQISE